LTTYETLQTDLTLVVHFHAHWSNENLFWLWIYLWLQFLDSNFRCMVLCTFVYAVQGNIKTYKTEIDSHASNLPGWTNSFLVRPAKFGCALWFTL